MCLLIGSVSAREWRQLDAGDFIIYSDASNAKIEDLALDYSAYILTLRTLILEKQDLPHVTLVLFDRPKDMAHYAEAADNKWSRKIPIGTVYQVDRQPLVALADVRKKEELFQALTGFQTGPLIALTGFSPPPWLHQAVGSILASMERTNQGVQLGVDRRGYREELQQPSSNSWERFFTGKCDLYFGVFSNSSNPEQARAWALGQLLLLNSKGQSVERFKDLAGHLTHEVMTESAMGKILDPHGETLDMQIAQFAQRNPAARTIPFDPNDFRQSWSFQPVEPWKLKLVYAEMLIAGKRADEARVLLDEVKAQNPNRPDLMVAEAHYELAMGNIQAAIALYDALASAYPGNIAFGLMSALLDIDPQGTRLNSRFFLNNESYVETRNPTNTVRKLRSVIKIDPGFKLAYVLLGRIFQSLPVIDESMIGELGPGIANTYYGSGTRFYRAKLLDRMGRHDEANEDYRVLSASSNAYHFGQKSRLHLANAKVSSDARTLNELLNSNRDVEATALINQALTDPITKIHTAQYQRFLTVIEERQAWREISRLMTNQQWSEVPAKADAFCKTYPRSNLRRGVEKMGESAQRMLNDSH
ncbi:MAG: hypothetical protein K9M98_05155 [Cephaloticoccus sp.]|nr:hypothetical protein [Cephaloticoccus sp.]MCF7759870.1 hypothetical protein [Cephaloticoccus sp.]